MRREADPPASRRSATASRSVVLAALSRCTGPTAVGSGDIAPALQHPLRHSPQRVSESPPTSLFREPGGVAHRDPLIERAASRPPHGLHFGRAPEIARPSSHRRVELGDRASERGLAREGPRRHLGVQVPGRNAVHASILGRYRGLVNLTASKPGVARCRAARRTPPGPAVADRRGVRARGSSGRRRARLRRRRAGRRCRCRVRASSTRASARTTVILGRQQLRDRHRAASPRSALRRTAHAL